MASDEEKAEVLRRIASLYESIGSYDRANIELKTADKLDPPKPDLPDGLYHCEYGGDYPLTVYMWRRDGKWLNGFDRPDDGIAEPHTCTRVRVLADDEIPLPRSTFAGMTWEEASKRAGLYMVGGQGYKVWSAIADALRDEGERP